MKKIIFVGLMFASFTVAAQTVSLRVVQSNYNSTDPDGVGPATGSVSFRFEIFSSTPVLADALGLSVVYQSANLMAPSPLGTVVRLGTLATAVNWSQPINNQVGNTITPLSYGGQSFNTRMIIGFTQGEGTPNCAFGPSWTPVCEITYWTKGTGFPQGGYVVNEPGTILPQNELSSDGGGTLYQLESPNFNSPTPLGGALPVLFSSFDAKCSNNGTLISWSTAQEANSSKFEVERSINGSTWTNIGSVPAAGTSVSNRNYQQIDLFGGTALYRIKQIDKDGQSIYTDVARTNCQTKNISSVIYPVPTKDILNLVIKSDRSVRTQFLVYDMQGKLVKKVDAAVISGNNNFRINLIGLASGDYMLRSNDASLQLNKVFTIAR